MLFNFFVPITLAINRIMVSRDIPGEHQSHLILMAIIPPIIATLFAYYVWKALREAKDYHTIIKPQRFKYFFWGTFSSFVSFNMLIIALVVSYKVTNLSAASATVYSVFGLSFVFGLTSAVCITMYEFCSCFDIFYSKNKHTIIQEYLERQKDLKIIEGTKDEN